MRTLMKADCYRTGKDAACRRVPARFSPETVQARAVKGLTLFAVYTYRPWCHKTW